MTKVLSHLAYALKFYKNIVGILKFEPTILRTCWVVVVVVAKHVPICVGFLTTSNIHQIYCLPELIESSET